MPPQLQQQNPFAAPQGAPPAPPMMPLPQEFRPHAQYILSGNFLQQGNPFTQGLLDDQRREAERTYGGQRAQLSAATSGLGQFGSSQGNMLAGQLMGQHAQGLASQQNQTMFGVHEAERGRMMEALQALGAFDTATADRSSAEMMHQASLENQLRIAELQRQAQMAASQGNLRAAQIAAENALQLQANQLEFDRMGLGLSGLMGMGDQQLREMEILAALTGQSMAADQGMMGLAGQMGMGWGNQFLGAMGLVPGMEGAGYMGYGTALGAQQGLDQQAAAAAARQQQSQMQRWQYGRYNPQDSLGWYANILGAIGGMGGTSDTEGLAAPGGVPAVGNTNPFLGALQGGLGGYLFGRGQGWGGGGSSPGTPPLPSWAGGANVNPGGLPLFIGGMGAGIG